MSPTDRDWDSDRDSDWDGGLLKLPYNEVRDFMRLSKLAQASESRLTPKLNLLRRRLRDNDFVFFIDCSPSMENHRDQIREAFLTYVNLVLRISIRGFEVVFSSRPRTLSRFSTLAGAQSIFDKQDWGEPQFVEGFEKFVNSSILRELSTGRYYGGHLRIFVLTDGTWGTEGTSVIEDSVHRIKSEQMQRLLEPHVVTLQFMTFGNDVDGTKKLSSLIDLNTTSKRSRLWGGLILDTSKYDADIQQVLGEAIFRKRERPTGLFSSRGTAIDSNATRPQSLQIRRRTHLLSGTDEDTLTSQVKTPQGTARSASEDKDILSAGLGEDDMPAAAEEAKPTRLLKSWSSVYYPAYTLPLFVDGLLDSWGLRQPSPSSSHGLIQSLRIHWECACGRQLSEQVSRLHPNGPESLNQSHPEPRESDSQSLGGALGVVLTKSQQIISATIAITREAFKGLMPPKSNGINSSLPLHNTNANTGGRTTQQSAQPHTWLLLCIDKGPKRTSFYQEVFLNITNDQALFDFLRDKYFAHRKFRSWFTLRGLQSLALAQFQIDANSYPDIMEHRQHCLQKEVGCYCIPPANRVGESREYHCSPAPAEPPRFVPVLTPERLTHYFLRPHEFADPQTYILEQLPKRSGPQLKAHPEKLVEGWGLYFQEGWHWPSVAFICAFFTFIGIIFGVVWSAVTADIQSGFAVTAIFVALPVLPLAFMFNRDSL